MGTVVGKSAGEAGDNFNEGFEFGKLGVDAGDAFAEGYDFAHRGEAGVGGEEVEFETGCGGRDVVDCEGEGAQGLPFGVASWMYLVLS